MEVMLHATLAGGVAIGSVANVILTGGIAMVIGAVAGCVHFRPSDNGR